MMRTSRIRSTCKGENSKLSPTVQSNRVSQSLIIETNPALITDKGKNIIFKSRKKNGCHVNLARG